MSNLGQLLSHFLLNHFGGYHVEIFLFIFEKPIGRNVRLTPLQMRMECLHQGKWNSNESYSYSSQG